MAVGISFREILFISLSALVGAQNKLANAVFRAGGLLGLGVSRILNILPHIEVFYYLSDADSLHNRMTPGGHCVSNSFLAECGYVCEHQSLSE